VSGLLTIFPCSVSWKRALWMVSEFLTKTCSPLNSDTIEQYCVLKLNSEKTLNIFNYARLNALHFVKFLFFKHFIFDEIVFNNLMFE
jgi:hypothetical protein